MTRPTLGVSERQLSEWSGPLNDRFVETVTGSSWPLCKALHSGQERSLCGSARATVLGRKGSSALARLDDPQLRLPMGVAESDD